jgi:hypothetical protein
MPIGSRVSKAGFALMAIVALASGCTTGAQPSSSTAPSSGRPAPTTHVTGPDAPTPVASGTPQVAVPPFVPATTEEDGQTVMGITLPNGDHLDLLYGPDLDLAAMGAQPDLTVVRPGTTERIPLFFVHDPAPGSEYLADGPIETHAGPGGTEAEV